MVMRNQTKGTTMKTIDQAIRELDPPTAQTIREAYYKAAEGLQTLAETLEIADARMTPTTGPLLIEHFIAIEALDSFNKSQLGRVL